MKRRFAGALVGAVVAGSLGIASPAQAQGCMLGPTPQEELISTGSPIQIYLGRVPGYATAVAGWAADYAGCLVQYEVDCVQEVGPKLPLVEIDPETLTVTIHQENLAGSTYCVIDPR